MVPQYLKTLSNVKAQKAAVVEPKNFLQLGKAMQSFVGAWPKVSGYSDILRASGMYDVCPREFVFNYWNPTPHRFFDYKSQFMMATGSHLHTFMQDKILGPMGVLRGVWVDETGTKVEGYHPDPMQTIHEVTQQKPVSWKYEEYTVWDEKTRIAGHLDGLVSVERIAWLADHMKLVKADPIQAFKELQSVPPGEEATFELKTTGNYIFGKTKTSADIPPYYKMQAAIYQHLSKRDKTVFWYLNRDDMNSNIMIYQHEPGWWIEAANKARVIWESIRDERLPDVFNKCNLPTDKRATQCVFKQQCFQKWGRGQFKTWVDDCVVAQPDRKFLNLTGMDFTV